MPLLRKRKKKVRMLLMIQRNKILLLLCLFPLMIIREGITTSSSVEKIQQSSLPTEEKKGDKQESAKVHSSNKEKKKEVIKELVNQGTKLPFLQNISYKSLKFLFEALLPLITVGSEAFFYAKDHSPLLSQKTATRAGRSFAFLTLYNFLSSYIEKYYKKNLDIQMKRTLTEATEKSLELPSYVSPLIEKWRGASMAGDFKGLAKTMKLISSLPLIKDQKVMSPDKGIIATYTTPVPTTKSFLGKAFLPTTLGVALTTFFSLIAVNQNFLTGVQAFFKDIIDPARFTSLKPKGVYIAGGIAGILIMYLISLFRNPRVMFTKTIGSFLKHWIAYKSFFKDSDTKTQLDEHAQAFMKAKKEGKKYLTFEKAKQVSALLTKYTEENKALIEGPKQGTTEGHKTTFLSEKYKIPLYLLLVFSNVLFMFSMRTSR